MVLLLVEVWVDELLVGVLLLVEVELWVDEVLLGLVEETEVLVGVVIDVLVEVVNCSVEAACSKVMKSMMNANNAFQYGETTPLRFGCSFI